MDPAALRVLQTLLALMILRAVAPVPCPRPCSCPQPTELHCTFRSLITIPASVSKHVERMNLGFNSINKVTDKSLAGLRKLELLMVHGNDIHNLPDGVFKDLASLQMLKMSYNKLKEINRHTLLGLWALARLHLDHNQLEFIHPDAFQGLTSLRLLQLEGNRLQQLHPATFATLTLMGHFHISTLRHLYLSDNGLRSLPSRLVATMPQLENLYLHGNPWICDCNMRWLQDWDKTSPGVLKCKKDRALPGGQLCPMCSSPKHLLKQDLQTVENLLCGSPVISSPHRTSPPEDVEESDVLTAEDFSEPFGNISLGLSDEHGNEVDLDCSIGEPGDLTRINWEHVDPLQLASNITLSVDVECPVDREKYERLWRLVAYYSSVPAHLQRGLMVRKEPYPTYVYRQDSEKDALYYTGVKANIMARPAWIMQTSVDLQLNRLKSSAKMVKLTLSTEFTETVEAELVRRQRRTWVVIESTNTTREVSIAILGSRSQMNCNVHSSGQPVIHWMLPDGSKVEAPHSSPDNRMSVSREGRLIITAVSHRDAGLYYCVAKVQGDLAVLPFHLTVQESSSPPPGEDESSVPLEGLAGNPISLPCAASGSPDADISWILPSSNIVSFHANSSRALVSSNGTLHITPAQLLDSGYYKCIAINKYGLDTLVKKITVIRQKGLIRPLRKFPARPQSASGVSTQIKVPTEDAEEASGDVEVTQTGSPISRLNPLRKRIQGGVATGRRGIHPMRNMWRRPPVLRKQTGSRVDDNKNVGDSRRKINMSKSKIDPEKWADILAKIRDRNAQNTVTPPPVQHTTERKLTEQTTLSQETTEGSSDGQESLTTPQRRVQHTQMKTNTHTTQGQNSYTARDTHANSELTHSRYATEEPHVTQAAYNTQHATPDANLEPHTTSNGVFFLPQTTSIPPHAVTLWQANTNSAGSSTFSPQDNHSTNTDADGGTTAEWVKEPERNKDVDRPTGSNDDTERSASVGQIIPPNEPGRSQEENEKDLSPTATSQSQPEDITLDLESQAMLTTVSPTTPLVATTTRMWASEVHSPPRLRQPNSRRRNGGRQRRPNRRRQKQKKPKQFIATTPEDVALATVSTTSSSELKTEPIKVTTASFNPTVPFSGSQAASSGKLSHEESTDSGHDAEAATELSAVPASPPETSDSVVPLAKQLFESTSAVPSFPTASPGVGHGKTSSQTTLGISESQPVSPGRDFTASTQQWFTGSHLPPVKPLEETRTMSIPGLLDPVSRSDSSSGGFHAVTQVRTHVGQDSSDHQYTPTEEGGTMLPPLSTAASSLIERDIKTTSGHTSRRLIPTPNLIFGGNVNTEQVTTNKLPALEMLYQSSSESEVDITNINRTHPPVTRPDGVIPSTVMPYVTLPPTSSTGATTQAPRINSIPDISQAPQIPPSTTSEPQQASDFSLATQSTAQPDPFISINPTPPAPNLTSRQTLDKVTAVAPTTAAIRTNPFEEQSLTSTQDVSRKHQLPGQGSVPRGKPRITQSNFQTFTVKAETDAQLPCEAVGEPMPFLSWTRVADGMSIAHNTKAHRFEVHANGTLIIRNTGPMDGGQYLCAVQNQYGTDKMAVNLVVLFQHPHILQPRHRDVTVHLGGKVDLDCVVEGHPVPRITWVLPHHIQMAPAPSGVATQQRVAIMSNGTLRISRATFADGGIYKCTGSSAAGADTVSVRLHVSQVPPVIQQMKHENTTLPEGSIAYVHCTATGAPHPVVHWITPDGLQLAASRFIPERKLNVFPNGTLLIQGLGLRHSGRYECLASNTVGSSRRTVFLSIKRTASFMKASIKSSSPQKTDVIYGGRLLLNCVATGEPEPRIIWRTPSKKLVDAQYSFDPRINVFNNGSITIHPVTDDDGGDYLCVARNKMGDDYVLLRVGVLTRPAKIKQRQQQFSQEVVYGGDLKVDCVASGLPNPKISWALPDGTMVNPIKQREGRSRRYVVFDNGTLYFNDVGMPEEGDYTCYAENQLGKDEMKVRVKVKVATSPPRIQDKHRSIVRVFYGETVTLTCNAKGEPVPVVTWISPTNRVIAPALDKYQVLNDGTLVIQKVQRFDGGNYTCMARNNAGQDHKVIGLEVLVTSPMINGLSGTANSIKVTAIQDHQKFLDCVAKGTPTPRIMWVLPGNVILPAPYYGNRMTVHQNGTLEIRSPKRTDSGQLACIARNEGGEVRLVVNLNVKEGVVERPQIKGPNTDRLSLTVGNAMTLNCSVEGSMLPRVTWILPDGTPLHSGAQHAKFFHRPDGSLIISNPSVAEAGMYRCLGHSFQGLMERIITLSPGRKPEINNRYNSPLSIMNGDQLSLHCLVSGEPLRLTWTLPSGVVLNRPQRAGRYAVLSNGTLSINQASVYDRGSYVCRAANEYGSSVLSASVTVIAYPPRITNGPPAVTYAKRGVAVQLNCLATGIPRVDVAWETPDKIRLAVSAQPRLFGNKYLHPQGSLVIQNPTQRDAGVYRCTARNAVGIDSKATFLNVF